MMARKYSSTATALTVAAVLSGDLTITVSASPTASGWPSSFPYSIIVDPDTASEEVCTVTAVAGQVCTVTRGVDGTTAVAHNAGAAVRHGVSARDFSEPQVHIDDTTTAHGVTGAVAGTTNVQTLTNKTLTSPTINAATLSGAVTSTATITGGTVNPTTLQQGGVVAVVTTDSRLSDTRTPSANSITTGMIIDGAILNADVNAAAAIDKTKISGTAVTLADTATVSNTMLAGSIANAKLANSSVTVGSTAVSLGATAATVAGLTLTSPTVNGATIDGATTLGGTTGTVIAAAAVKAPYAMSAGSDSMTLTAASSQTKVITFPVSRFSVAPIVQVTKVETSGSAITLVAMVTATSASQMTVGLYSATGATLSVTVTFHWTAIQMTSGSASG